MDFTFLKYLLTANTTLLFSEKAASCYGNCCKAPSLLNRGSCQYVHCALISRLEQMQKSFEVLADTG